MRHKSLYRIDIIFFLSLITFFILAFMTIRSEKEVTASRELEERTHSIIRKFDQLLTYVLNIETSNRGYAISGNQKFITSINREKENTSKVLDSLRSLIIDEEQIIRLDTVSKLVQKKIEYSDRIIPLRDAQGIDSTMRYIAVGRGDQIMDSIRLVVRRASNRAIQLLTVRSQRTDQKRSTRAVYFTLIAIIALLVMVSAYYLIRRSVRNLLVTKSEQQELINELSHQNKQLDDFAHMTSHNLRGPANNIKALVSMLNNESPLSEFQLIVGKINQVSQNLSGTLSELLEIVASRKKEVEKTTLRFEDFLVREKQNLEGQILQAGVEIHSNFTGAPTIEYSAAYLESILHNLVSNAIKYRSPEKSLIIYIKSEVIEGQTWLHVSDNGMGIDLTKYGDKLFGLKKTFHEHPDARGIGLYMTKNQVESMGGKISVQSKPGEGTIFSIKF